MSTAPPFTDPRFDAEATEPYEPKKRSPWTTCLIGCLVVALILIVIAAGLTFWVVRNARGWSADIATLVIEQGIDSTQLPQQEKDEIKFQVARVTTAFREGRLTGAQLGRIADDISKSPLMPLLVVSALDQAYLAKSGLSDEEKADGRITLQRFMRGVIDEKINQQGIDAAMVHVADRGPDGDWRLRQRLTDQELRDFLTAAKAEADKAGVEAAPADFDPSDEFKRIIDAALAQPPAVMPDDSAEPADEGPKGIGEEEQPDGAGGA